MHFVFDDGSSSVEFASKVFEQVAGEMVGRINERASFVGKLEKLEVVIRKAEKTDGMYLSTSERENYIFLSVDKKDSYKKLSFAIAHELAHLLMSIQNDRFFIGGKANDGSNNYSAVARVIFSTEETYGEQLEELIADYIARFICEKLGLEDENKTYEAMMLEKKQKFEIVRKLELLFKSDLMSKDEIDYYKITEEKVEYSYFWTCVVTNAFNNVVDIWNEEGKCTFKEFCNKVKKFFFEPNDENYEDVISELNGME